jgi:hypothetical protein
MMTSSTPVTTYELELSVDTIVMPIAIVVIPVATDFLKKSFELIDRFNILHNTIEQIDPFV